MSTAKKSSSSSGRRRTRAIRVLIVDDHPPILLGLRAILEAEDGIDVCGEARTCEAAAKLTAALRPDLVLLDTTLPDMDLRTCVQALRRAHAGTQIVALCEQTDCDRTLELLDAGMSGCVAKSDAPRTILAAVRTVSEGLVYLNPVNTERLTRAFRTMRVGERRKLDLLTEVERQVLNETASGFTGPEVAERLSIPLSTVNTARNRLMQKLSLHSRSELVHFALESGVLSATSDIDRASNGTCRADS